jgi:hypothetical protein
VTPSTSHILAWWTKWKPTSLKKSFHPSHSDHILLIWRLHHRWCPLKWVFFFHLACSKISLRTHGYILSMVFHMHIYHFKAVKQSNAMIVDLTNDQTYGHSDTYMSFWCSEAGQRGDCGSVDYMKIDGWHRHMVASISMTYFHWLSLIHLVTMKLICQLEPIWESVAWVFALSPINQGFKTLQLINVEL